MKKRRKKKQLSPPKISIPHSEIELCEGFIGRATNEGLLVYPEVEDWDMVLVNSAGEQLGVQAKMVPNVKVLYQACRRPNKGPQYRAVLVKHTTRYFTYVAKSLNLAVFDPVKLRMRRVVVGHDYDKLCRNWGCKPLWLPPVPSEVKAGSPCPRPLTKWRTAALRLCNELSDKGFLTGEDFKAANVSRTVWLNFGWLKRDGKVGRFARYVKGPCIDWANKKHPFPSEGFEVEAQKLRALDEGSP
jgi:hypothetical protein